MSALDLGLGNAMVDERRHTISQRLLLNRTGVRLSTQLYNTIKIPPVAVDGDIDDNSDACSLEHTIEFGPEEELEAVCVDEHFDREGMAVPSWQ
jgi:hypothetical protein